MDELVTLEGYVCEVGDLGLGMKGGKLGKGVLLELDGSYIEIRGLSGPMCRVLAKHLREKVRVTVSASSNETISNRGESK